ncbi:MAG: Mov34/MPN/PAD-1 family protein [Solirubrobacteraceae bacterium]
MRIRRDLVEEMLGYALAERPRECCGLVAASGDEAVRVYPVVNTHDHPEYGYVVDGRELLERLDEIEGEGWTLGAIYHSHPRTAPVPSQTDINLAFVPDVGPVWPGSLYIIVGFETAEPCVRAYRIDSSTPEEVELSVE